ncbi:hypothetical protein TcCL_Unassigned07475, partial [Trypanosoma cruzi]
MWEAGSPRECENVMQYTRRCSHKAGAYTTTATSTPRAQHGVEEDATAASGEHRSVSHGYLKTNVPVMRVPAGRLTTVRHGSSAWESSSSSLLYTGGTPG